MAAVTYLLRADLRRRWRSLALLALLVAIVEAGLLTATAGARRTRTTLDRFLDQVRPVDAMASVDSPTEPGNLTALATAAVADTVPLPARITFPVAALLLVPLVITALAQIGASLSRRSAGRVRPALALRAE